MKKTNILIGSLALIATVGAVATATTLIVRNRSVKNENFTWDDIAQVEKNVITSYQTNNTVGQIDRDLISDNLTESQLKDDLTDIVDRSRYTGDAYYSLINYSKTKCLNVMDWWEFKQHLTEMHQFLCLKIMDLKTLDQEEKQKHIISLQKQTDHLIEESKTNNLTCEQLTQKLIDLVDTGLSNETKELEILKTLCIFSLIQKNDWPVFAKKKLTKAKLTDDDEKIYLDNLIESKKLEIGSDIAPYLDKLQIAKSSDTVIVNTYDEKYNMMAIVTNYENTVYERSITVKYGYVLKESAQDSDRIVWNDECHKYYVYVSPAYEMKKANAWNNNHKFSFNTSQCFFDFLYKSYKENDSLEMDQLNIYGYLDDQQINDQTTEGYKLRLKFDDFNPTTSTVTYHLSILPRYWEKYDTTNQNWINSGKQTEKLPITKQAQQEATMLYEWCDRFSSNYSESSFWYFKAGKIGIIALITITSILIAILTFIIIYAIANHQYTLLATSIINLASFGTCIALFGTELKRWKRYVSTCNELFSNQNFKAVTIKMKAQLKAYKQIAKDLKNGQASWYQIESLTSAFNDLKNDVMALDVYEELFKLKNISLLELINVTLITALGLFVSSVLIFVINADQVYWIVSSTNADVAAIPQNPEAFAEVKDGLGRAIAENQSTGLANRIYSTVSNGIGTVANYAWSGLQKCFSWASWIVGYGG